MKSNVTGGIILFLAGAGIIALGTTEKGKTIFNMIFSGSTTTGELPELPELEGDEYNYSGTPNDPDYTPPPNTSNMYGFNGEKGAIYAG